MNAEDSSAATGGRTLFAGPYQILILAVVFEGLLAGVFLLWLAMRHPFWSWHFEPAHLWQGLLAAFPLWGVNWLLVCAVRRPDTAFVRTREFLEEIVIPLSAACTVPVALLVSCLAGVGEELFFRGMLQTEFGIVLASVAFAVMHFGKAVLLYPFLVVVYAVMSVYLGALFAISNSIWPPIIAHAIYDAGVLLYFKRLARCGARPIN